MIQIAKYPRTQHIEGSRLQPGDHDLDSVPFSKIKDRFLVVEEKVDGANSGISLSNEGQLLLQSRGHYLTGGGREKHFSLFKRWATSHFGSISDLLGNRYLMYGEWLFAKHTIFYDRLSHYFQEFDILDRETNEFLSTKRRSEMLVDSPIQSVRVLYEGTLSHLDDLLELVGPSAFMSDLHLEKLASHATENGLDPAHVIKETDRSNLMEGLYIKVEEDGVVKERYKYVRHDFLTAVSTSGTHWLDRPILCNLLKKDVDLYGNNNG
jgi:hypothetical protein